MYSYNYVSTGELQAVSLTELFTQKSDCFIKDDFKYYSQNCYF